jgi:hypothetical protein
VGDHGGLPPVSLSPVEQTWLGVDVVYAGAEWFVVAVAPYERGESENHLWLCDGAGFTRAPVSGVRRTDYDQPTLL